MDNHCSNLFLTSIAFAYKNLVERRRFSDFNVYMNSSWCKNWEQYIDMAIRVIVQIDINF